MHSFEARSVTEALQKGLEHLLHEGLQENSRNGPVLVAPGPVCTEYLNPKARVLFSPTRDANPWFSMFESLWMLSGNNDIEFPCYFAKTYGQYSDDGKTMWDAYGHRWRRFFGWDQLDAIVAELKANAQSRRCVLSMWNAAPTIGEQLHEGSDDDFYVATHGGKAVPCNTQAYFDVRGGKLNMTVLNRSNDAVFGCYGANAVHFSFLLEYMAVRVGVPMGVYRQFSNNLHLYTTPPPRAWAERVIEECREVAEEPHGPSMEPGFDDDLKVFMQGARAMIRESTTQALAVMMHPMDYRTALFQAVAAPMFNAWYCRKNRMLDMSDRWTAQIAAPDWKRACQEWIARRAQ